MNEIEQLAQEFYNVFKAVEEVIPDLSKYFLSAQQPSWLPLKKGGSVSMRDYILIKWSESQQQKKAYLDKDLLLTCALSFDVVSRANHFDVDHFFPQSEMMKNLDSLSINQKLLEKIKKKLIKLLKINKENEGISNKEASIYANNVVDRLIPVQNKQLLVTGLKHIYYNYPANLWPISGPVNRSKGKKESIDSAMSFVFARIESLLGDQNSKKLAIKTAKYLEVKEEKIKWDTDHNKQESIVLLRKGILKKFYDNCNSSNITKSILPYYKDVTEIVSMLTFFQATPVGKTSLKFSRETAINARQAFCIARSISYHAMAQDLVTDANKEILLKSVSEGARRLVKIFRKSLEKELNNSMIAVNSQATLLNVETSSDSGVSSSKDGELIASVIEKVAERTQVSAKRAAERLRGKAQSNLKELTATIPKLSRL